MRAKLLEAFRILPWLFVALAAAYLFLADGMADISLGRHHRIAREFFQNKGRITIGIIPSKQQRKNLISFNF